MAPHILLAQAPAAAATEALTAMRWAEFGLGGLVIIALFSVLIFLFKSHKSERDEWRVDAKEKHSETMEVTKGFTKVVTDLTDAVKDLKRT